MRILVVALALLRAYAAFAAPVTVALSGTIYNVDLTPANAARVLVQNKHTQNISGVIDPPYLKTLITNSSGAIPSSNFLGGEYLTIQIDAAPPQAVELPLVSETLAALLENGGPTLSGIVLIVAVPLDLKVSGSPVTVSSSLSSLSFSVPSDWTLTGSPVAISTALTQLGLVVPVDLSQNVNGVRNAAVTFTATSASPGPVPISLSGIFYLGAQPCANCRVNISNRFVRAFDNGVIRQSSKTLITNSAGVMPTTNFVQGLKVTVQVNAGKAQDITLPYSNTADLTALMAVSN